MLQNNCCRVFLNRVPHELCGSSWQFFWDLELPDEGCFHVRSHLSPWIFYLRPSVIAKKRRNKDIDQVHEDLKVHMGPWTPNQLIWEHQIHCHKWNKKLGGMKSYKSMSQVEVEFVEMMLTCPLLFFNGFSAATSCTLYHVISASETWKGPHW